MVAATKARVSLSLGVVFRPGTFSPLQEKNPLPE